MAASLQLLGMSQRSAVETGSALAVGGRRSWTVRVRCSKLGTGALTISLQASATGDDADFVERKLVTVTVAGEQALRAGSAADFIWNGWDIFMRAKVLTIGTGWVFDVIAEASYLDYANSEDQALLSKELNTYSRRDALVDAAEQDVINYCTRAVDAADIGAVTTPVLSPFLIASYSLYGRSRWDPPPYDYLPGAADQIAGEPQAPVLDLAPQLLGFADRIRYEIARQAEHLFLREKLAQSREASAIVSLRTMGLQRPGFCDTLSFYQNSSNLVWRGR